MTTSELNTCFQPFIERMAKAQSEFVSEEQSKTFADELSRDIRVAFGLAHQPDTPEAPNQIDTSANIEIADTEILAKFCATSKRLTSSIEALQLELAQKLEQLKLDKELQTDIMAKTKSAKAKASAEQLIGGFEKDIIIIERAIASFNDILPGMHAEFEARCNEKIAQMTKAVEDPSSWNADVAT